MALKSIYIKLTEDFIKANQIHYRGVYKATYSPGDGYVGVYTLYPNKGERNPNRGERMGIIHSCDCIIVSEALYLNQILKI